MTDKQFTIKRKDLKYAKILENGKDLTGYFFIAQAKFICDKWNELAEENEQLKSQLYCDDEEGVCNICKHHYLIKDDESELGYYNSRCRKGHYECAKVSLKHCEDFEKELI